jgi:hypothetical protein
MHPDLSNIQALQFQVPVVAGALVPKSTKSHGRAELPTFAVYQDKTARNTILGCLQPQA